MININVPDRSYPDEDVVSDDPCFDCENPSCRMCEYYEFENDNELECS